MHHIYDFLYKLISFIGTLLWDRVRIPVFFTLSIYWRLSPYIQAFYNSYYAPGEHCWDTLSNLETGQAYTTTITPAWQQSTIFTLRWVCMSQGRYRLSVTAQHKQYVIAYTAGITFLYENGSLQTSNQEDVKKKSSRCKKKN